MIQPDNTTSATNSTFTDVSPAALTTGQPDTPVNPLHAHVQDILQRAPLDDDTRAEMWDRFFDSGHSYHLAKHLTLYPSVPDDVKASLVAAKKTTDPEHLERLENTVAAIESMARLDPAVLEKVEAHPNVFQSLLRAK